MRRLQVSEGRRLTYRDLAQMAGTSERTMAEWMRGATSPMAMNGLLNLMSALKADDVFGPGGQQVHQLALAFIAPLGAHNNQI